MYFERIYAFCTTFKAKSLPSSTVPAGRVCVTDRQRVGASELCPLFRMKDYENTVKSLCPQFKLLNQSKNFIITLEKTPAHTPISAFANSKKRILPPPCLFVCLPVCLCPSVSQPICLPSYITAAPTGGI